MIVSRRIELDSRMVTNRVSIHHSRIDGVVRYVFVYVERMTETIPSPIQNIMGMCKQIIPLIFTNFGLAGN